MQLHYGQLRILGEARIAEARPGGSVVAACGLAIAGMAVLSMSPLFLLAGLFAPPMWWIGLGIVSCGAVCFVLAWGCYRGYLWGWFGAEMLAVFSLALAWWMTRVGSPVLSTLAALVVVDQLAVQVMLWSRPVRDWFFQCHRIRAHRYRKLDLELAGRR